MPTANYRLPDGTPVSGTTTILGAILNKPALVPWGYSQGKENYDRITKQILSICNVDRASPGDHERLIDTVKKTILEFQVGKLYDKRDAAASAGTLGHSLVEADIKGWPEPKMEGVQGDVKDKAEGCYLAYREWKDRTRFKLIHSEIPLVSVIHRFGGCLDIGGGVTDLELIDLKTSKGIYFSMWLQVAGYGILWDEVHPDNPIKGYNILRIGPEGDFSHERRIALPREKKIFIKTVEIFNEMKLMGVKL